MNSDDFLCLEVFVNDEVGMLYVFKKRIFNNRSDVKKICVGENKKRWISIIEKFGEICK